MQRTTRIVTFATVLMMALPAAHATWMLAGSFEPNTPYDTSAWMWSDPAPLGQDRIYFAAFTTYSAAGNVPTNPNLGALRTQIEVGNSEIHRALFGVWKDCNGDGYVGMAETAAREYDARLLLDTSVCPPTSGSPNTWVEGAHNYNGWVSEYVPIARDPVNTAGSGDRRIYVDDDARVWGDFHRPDERPWQRSCAISPQPRGTWQSLGGIINYADCRSGTLGVDTIGAMNTAFAAVGDPMGWHFSDTDDARSGTLGQTPTFGRDGTEHSAVHVWDCSSGEYEFHSGDFFNQTPLGPSIPAPWQNIRVNDVSPSLGNLQDPTVPGTLNDTMEGAQDCDTSNDFGHDFYTGTCGVFVYCWGEGDFNGVDPNNKREANWNFGFVTSARGQLPYNLLPGGSGPTGIPANLGIGWGGSGWQPGSYWLSKPGFGVVRTDLDDPTRPDVGFAHAYWVSFFAHAGPATAARGFLVPGGSDVYGAWHCGLHTSGIRNGWNCDVSKWNRNPDGTPLQPAVPAELENHELVMPGQPYEFRDVDCYDGRIGDTGLGVQPAFYGAAACP